ncbi:angiotensin-converting enzyme [Anabrus simplex]|uniref:angiotensin-converting enzyme n=1 Tax=Anabrus simplex TaxID=316456 RepID=UPI0035A2B9A2
MANCREPNELKHYWLAWRTATGRQMGGRYRRYVELLNEAAVLNNMTDAAQMWLLPYDEHEIRHNVRMIWEEVKPLYLQLHAYVRRKLRDRYGEALVGSRAPIPAHLLGNMWGQSWNNLFNITLPAPASVLPDITARMQCKGYNPMRMFREAESFFTSLNLSAMPLEFWENSIIEKPQDGREMVCHASAWDMYDGKDFRIKMCTEVTLEDFLIIHHEMGHIQYYIQYSHLPVVFREGANPGFHEAIGDVMSLSVSTLTHMHHLGFVKKAELSDPDADLNFLFLMALQKVAFLPFGYLVDKWRWDVFEGKVAPQAYNKHWWRLREKFQGVAPPERRTCDDFDPGSKYHIAAGVPFIRYFISSIIQFQFHRALCIEAGLYNPKNKYERPLHQCDIYHNAKAGNLIKRMMQMGSSRPWPDAMEVMTGQRKLTPSGILEYFAPLQRWLENENSFKREFIGWDSYFEQEKHPNNAHHNQQRKKTHSEDKINQT